MEREKRKALCRGMLSIAVVLDLKSDTLGKYRVQQMRRSATIGFKGCWEGRTRSWTVLSGPEWDYYISQN